jgi:polyphosphate kinase
MAVSNKRKTIVRDISWLSFNARVLQEAADATVPLRERVRFLGIFSNNLDEFFRVRVATLKRMIQFGHKANMHLENNPQEILDEIQMTVLNQQGEFHRIWEEVKALLKEQKIMLLTEKELNKEQQEYVRNHFEEEVSTEVIPLMIENIPQFPALKDKTIYLGVVMWKKESALRRKYALIEIPSRTMNRFVILPSPKTDEHHIILLEDVIRFSLPDIFSYFGYDQYQSHIFKVTRDAEIDIDQDVSTTIIQKLEKGIKNRRKAKAVRFVYDREMDPGLLEYLVRRMNLTKRDNLIPGGRIHNFRDFMEFPEQVFTEKRQRKKPFDHPLLTERRVSDVIGERCLTAFSLSFFLPLIDLLREAAFDPDVTTIKITCYRLASQSKIINALINAVRNGKEVVVMLELRARFEEEANLQWKERLEEEGAKVLVEIPNLKVHSKICVIRKKQRTTIVFYMDL